MSSQAIKEYGLSLGFTDVGITSIGSLAGYLEEVYARGDKYSVFHKILSEPVEQTMPWAKSVVVTVLDYFTADAPEALREMIGKLYLARCYTPPPGTLAHARLQLMQDFLAGQGYAVKIGGFNIPARWVAARAGVANIGRNTFAYADGAGSYIVIDTFVVDAELDYDTPTTANRCPPNCTACIDACPTKALYAPFKLDPARCIGFSNWMRRDGMPTLSAHIPEELRAGIGCKIHGCDICQDACPRNQKKLRQPKPADRYLAQLAPGLTLPAILNMSDETYTKRIKPIMYNYIRDKRYFMRNAAVAMGNAHNAGYVPALETALQNPDALVREYAAWALGQIGGPQAEAALAAHLPGEACDDVKQAITHALAHV
ncbi:MAG: epoxyqueuosine reductase [Ruminococcaceae bacterium]|nr:epoxyqueuosine reductase [Oscillospiraceae bacterium]